MVMEVNEPAVSYGSTDDNTVLSIMHMIRGGISYFQFDKVSKKIPFTLSEWSRILHISERTIQRYQSDNKSFEPIQSEKITQLTMLCNYGMQVFGSSDVFFKWLNEPSISLGGAAPKSFLDNSFGIDYIKNELGRIEHGVLA
jgi:putative toxin-antitoxin system antitoxin component (TIGR02293 family)